MGSPEEGPASPACDHDRHLPPLPEWPKPRVCTAKWSRPRAWLVGVYHLGFGTRCPDLTQAAGVRGASCWDLTIGSVRLGLPQTPTSFRRGAPAPCQAQGALP